MSYSCDLPAGFLASGLPFFFRFQAGGLKPPRSQVGRDALLGPKFRNEGSVGSCSWENDHKQDLKGCSVVAVFGHSGNEGGRRCGRTTRKTCHKVKVVAFKLKSDSAMNFLSNRSRGVPPCHTTQTHRHTHTHTPNCGISKSRMNTSNERASQQRRAVQSNPRI